MSYTAKKERRGVIAVIVAVCLIAILGIVALAIDGGILLDDARTVQAAADAAALAAGTELYKNWGANKGVDTDGKASASALLTAAANGFNNDRVTSTVTVNIPPASGVFAGKNGYAEVIVTYNQARGFSAIFGSATVSVQGRCVARGKKSGSDVGILTLNSTASGAFSLSGSASVTVNGKVVVNSNSSTAAVSSGSAICKAKELDIVGGQKSSSPSDFTADKVKYGAQPITDPLADVPAPDKSNMTIRSVTTYKPGSGEILQPGVYVGGIDISSKPNVIMAPGTYYLQGGGFTMSGGGSTLTANGVMIYNGAGADGKTGDVTVSGGGSIIMSPPTSGDYAGIALFQDRTATSKVTLSGGSTWNLTGTLYAPKAHFDISGGSGATMGSQYICDTLNLSGPSALNQIDPDLGYGPRDIRLTE
jgi:Putative Flp pilus-assembly TadE/G-like